MIHIAEGPTFHLANDRMSYAMRVTEESLLEHLSFGPALSDIPPPMARVLRHCTVMFEEAKTLTLNELPQELPTQGRGDLGMPALHLMAQENSVLSLTDAAHRLIAGKPALEGLPSSRTDGAQTLVVTLQDAVQRIEVDLHYTIWPEHAVLARRMEVRNKGAAPVSLRKVASTSLDLPSGRFSIGSSRGTFSNAHAHYLAILRPRGAV